MRELGVLGVCCVIVLCTVPTLAQDTTGRMLVRTSDAEAAPLPGVTVTIASPSLIGGARTIITDAKGEALFLTLAPGIYEARAKLHGFATQERTEVWVRLGSVTALMVTMLEATFEGEIVVFDETPVIDPMQVGTEQVFDAEYIEKTAIGTWQRFATSPAKQVPGVVDDYNILGSTESENAWFLDGIEVTQPSWGGLANGAAMIGIDAYQEIEVKTGGYEAEYGRALGGVISIVMKSGGNSFSGSLDVRYQPDAFQESGDHFDPDLQESSNLAIEATLGGPIIRDRLWFFASFYRGESNLTPEGSPTTRQMTMNAPKAKLTWQISNGWRGVATYFGSEYSNENLIASRWTMPEANLYLLRDPDHLVLGIDGMLSDTVMWTMRGGLDRQPFDSGPMRRDLEPIAHYNLSTGVLSNNFFYQSWNDIDRAQAATDLTWFLSGKHANHELKAGLAFTDTRATTATCSTGTPGGVRCSADVSGLLFYDRRVADNDVPNRMIEEYTAGPVDFSSVLWSGYVQDAWRPTTNLTVKAGLRYDRVAYEIDRTGGSVTMDRWQPRFGAAWDVTGDARNVVRLSAGRYMDPATLMLPEYVAHGYTTNTWLSCSYYAPTQGFDPSVCPSLGIPWRTDPEGWDPYGWFLYGVQGSTDSYVDPDLEAAYSDQLILSYERALWPRSSVEFSLVTKRTKSLFEDTCTANIPDPTHVESCEGWVTTNLPQLERSYDALIAKLESRSLDWLTVLASYTLSRSKGNQESSGYSYDWDLYPWQWENRSGYLGNHHTHDLKLNGYVLLPLDFTIAVNAGWRSASRWTPQVYSYDHPNMPHGNYFTEPRGNREGPSNSWLDLQFSKGFRIGPTHLDLIVSVLNVLSKEEATGVCDEVTGCGEIDGVPVQLGDPVDWETPRAWEIGFRLTF